MNDFLVHMERKLSRVEFCTRISLNYISFCSLADVSKSKIHSISKTSLFTSFGETKILIVSGFLLLLQALFKSQAFTFRLYSQIVDHKCTESAHYK